MKLSNFAPLAACVAFGLSGCGFTPLYAIPGVSPKLSQIDVAPPEGRTGFMLRQSLEDNFARDRDAPPTYRLVLKLQETRIPRGLRSNDVASRYELQLRAYYALVQISPRQLLTSGMVFSNTTFDSADAPYAGVAAQLDAEKRAAEDAAQQMRLELATYFAHPSPPPAQPGPGADDLWPATDRLAPEPIAQGSERAQAPKGRSAGAAP